MDAQRAHAGAAIITRRSAAKPSARVSRTGIPMGPPLGALRIVLHAKRPRAPPPSCSMLGVAELGPRRAKRPHDSFQQQFQSNSICFENNIKRAPVNNYEDRTSKKCNSGGAKWKCAPVLINICSAGLPMLSPLASCRTRHFVRGLIMPSLLAFSLFIIELRVAGRTLLRLFPLCLVISYARLLLFSSVLLSLHAWRFLTLTTR